MYIVNQLIVLTNVQEPSNNRFDIYQMVTDKIIECLDEGVVPWRKTWNDYGLPRNFISQKPYRGINSILLSLTKHEFPVFLTVKQVNDLGHTVRKGSKSHLVVFYKKSLQDEDGKYIKGNIGENREGLTERFLLRYYRVFNIADVEGLEVTLSKRHTSENVKIQACESVVENMIDAPTISYSDLRQCSYNRHTDEIKMPEINSFDSSHEFYNTLFHELTHATGHPKRLDRESLTKSKGFGDSYYSKDELIAEIGATFLCSITGVLREEIAENNSAYIQGWLEVLKEDQRLIFRAAKEAQKAVDWILTNE